MSIVECILLVLLVSAICLLIRIARECSHLTLLVRLLKRQVERMRPIYKDDLVDYLRKELENTPATIETLRDTDKVDFLSEFKQESLDDWRIE